MTYINCRISGIPYAKDKPRGDIKGPSRWSEAIKTQTKDLPMIQDACIVRITFLLPPDKFPADYPYGPDLDNLLKRMLDALNETVFRSARGKDSCVISLTALKTKVAAPDEAGAQLEVLPVIVD